MKKTDVIAQFENAQNNFILGLAGLSLLIEPDLRDRLKSNEAYIGGYKIPFDQVVQLMVIPPEIGCGQK